MTPDDYRRLTALRDAGMLKMTSISHADSLAAIIRSDSELAQELRAIKERVIRAAAEHYLRSIGIENPSDEAISREVPRVNEALLTSSDRLCRF